MIQILVRRSPKKHRAFKPQLTNAPFKFLCGFGRRAGVDSSKAVKPIGPMCDCCCAEVIGSTRENNRFGWRKMVQSGTGQRKDLNLHSAFIHPGDPSIGQFFQPLFDFSEVH